MLAWSFGMGRRIDIELTSKRSDGTWTWRAPGAPSLRGVVDSALLPDDAAPGNVLRAEADFDLEGILVTSIIGQKSEQHGGREGQRIEILGSPTKESTVSVSLATPEGKRRGGGLFDDRPPKKRGAPRGDRPERRPGSEGRPRTEGRPGSEGNVRDERTAQPKEKGCPCLPGPPDSLRPAAATRRRTFEGQPPTIRLASRTPSGTQSWRPSGRGGRTRELKQSTEHRNAALATLRPEQLPVAEQLLRGGIPALRRAIDEQNVPARSEGRTKWPPSPCSQWLTSCCRR